MGRTIVAAMFAESALVYGGLVRYDHTVFYIPWIFKFPPDLWRLLTSFLLTGGGYSFFFDLYFSAPLPLVSNRANHDQCGRMAQVLS